MTIIPALEVKPARKSNRMKIKKPDAADHNFIVGTYDYKKSSKKEIREKIRNGFFDEITKAVEIYSDEIVALFTCLRLEIYIYSSDRDNLDKIREIFLENKFGTLFGRENMVKHLTRLCSGKLSEIVAELQVTEQVADVFESQLEEGSKLEKVYQVALEKAASFRRKENFYNNENYATIASKIINDMAGGRIKGLLIVGAGMMAKEFVKTLGDYRERIDKFFIASRSRKKARALENILAANDVEIVDPQRINDVVKKVDVVFAAAGGRYKICGHAKPLFIVDITCPPMFILEDCPKTKIITMYDRVYKMEIDQVNNAFNKK